MYVEKSRRAEVLDDQELFIRPKLASYEALLINAPVDFQQGLIPDGEEPPIGLGRIASYANEKLGHKVGIYDVHRAKKAFNSKLTISDVEKTLTVLKDQGLKLIGLNATSVNVEATVEIAAICDKLGIPYVIGGYYATLTDNQDIGKAFPHALAIVKRDGEIPFAKILSRVKEYQGDQRDSEALRKKLNLVDIPGVFGPNDPEIPGEFAEKLSLAELPLIRPSEYYINHLEAITVNGKKYKEATIYVTDGCPYGCSFCASPVMKRRDYCHPGMDRFVDEIEIAIKDGATAIHCTDDLIFTKGSQIEELHRKLDERGLLGKFIWRGMGRVNVINKLTENQLELLKSSGCWQLAIGVESGSPRILKDIIRKGLKPEDVISVTKKLTNHGIGTKGFFIFGFPTETAKDIEMTYQLALDMARAGATGISAFEFHPYPGTELYRYIEQNMPEIIPQLEYLEVDWSAIGKDDVVGIDKARSKAQKTSMWLPENMRISELRSSEIRKAVLRTIADFESIKQSRETLKREKYIAGLESFASSILLAISAFPGLTSFVIPASMAMLDAMRRSNNIEKIATNNQLRI